MNCEVSRTVLLLVFYFCQGGHSTISKNSHHHQHHVTITKEASSKSELPSLRSELRERGHEVVIGKKKDQALFADSGNLQSHHHTPHRLPHPNPVKLKDGVEATVNAHWVLKFHDLPPWTPKNHRSQLESENGLKREKASGGPEKAEKAALSKARSDGQHGITLDLRSYNPLTAHLLTQSYIYPASNGLTQTDREYFTMIQSETGTSDVHFEKGGGVGHGGGGGDLGGGLGGAEGGGADAGEESKIKGLVALEAADGVSRQLAASDCSSGPCGGGDSNKASLTASTASNLKVDPSISTAATTASTTKTRTTATKKPMPRFAYHRVPGSFAAFRLIKPAFTEEQLPSPLSAFESFHDDEPPTNRNLFQEKQPAASRDVAAVHLV